MLIGMYILEGIFFLLWYKLIIRNEIDEKIVIRTIKLLKKYRKEIKENLFLRVNYCPRKKRNIEKIKKYVGDVFGSIIWLVLIAILCPIIVDAMPIFNVGLLGYILGIIVISVMILEEMRNCSQKYIEALKVYIKQVLVPLEKTTELVNIDEEEVVKIEWTRKMKVQMFLIVTFCILLFFLTEWLKEIMTNNVMAGIIIACLFGLVLFGDYIRNKCHKKPIEDIGIVFNGCEYFSIEEQVKDFCKKLNISNLKFSVWEENSNAFSRLGEDGIWEIALSRGLLLELEDMHRKGEMDISESMMIILGHEIGHAFYRDSYKNIKRRVGVALLIELVVMIMIFVFIFFFHKSILLLAIGGALMFFSALFGNVMCDVRYWLQIAELKADRIAIGFFAGGKDVFVRYFGRESRIKNEEMRKEKIDKANPFYRYYKHDVEVEGHPSVKRRIELVEKRNKWIWWEYFEHALMIRKWRRKRLGWNGVQ